MTPDGVGKSAELARVAWGDVDWRDERYRITSGEPDERLVARIAAWGCLSPPIMVAVDERLVPVAGFKRLAATARLVEGGDQLVTVWCLVEGLDVLGVLAVAARDIRRDRDLTPFEATRAIGVAQSVGEPRDVIVERLLPELGLEPHVTVLKRHRKLARVPRPLATWLEGKAASLRRALRFVGLQADEAGLLVELAEGLKLSLRALEECARMLGDVARRDATSLEEVAEQTGLLEAVRGKRAGSVGKRALERLWERRYPDWAAQRRLVAERVEAVAAPERVRFEWDDTFERDGVDLIVTARQVDELRRDLGALLEPDRIRRLDALLDEI